MIQPKPKVVKIVRRAHPNDFREPQETAAIVTSKLLEYPRTGRVIGRITASDGDRRQFAGRPCQR